MEGPRFQQKNAAASSGPAGSRKRPRFLTVEIPTGITDDTTADAYQRTMTPGDSPQTPRTPWRWESGMMQ